jgi:hypothetical protein
MYDPSENMDYRQLLELLKKSDPKEIYEKLMEKEENVLDVVNRVVNVSNEKEIVGKEFMNKSLNDHVYGFFWTIKTLMSDLKKTRTLQGILRELQKDERPIYIGVLLILTALFLFFVLCSGT